MKHTQKVFLLLNGEAPKNIPDFKNVDFICTTDGGFNTLKKWGITPDLITGDFDSSSHHPKEVETLHTPNQDFTDFDKMLTILHQRGYKMIDIYGASGKEQDHFLGNLHTALVWKDRLELTFFDDYGRYFFAKNNTTLSNVKDKTISLVPFPETKNITTNGLQYPLINENLSFLHRIGTRNRAIKNNVSIRFKEGNLLLFVNNRVINND